MNVLALVLGIVGLVPCVGWLFGPIAWILGNKSVKTIEAGAEKKGLGVAKVGKILGVIDTVQVVILLLFSVISAVLFPSVAHSMCAAQATALRMNGRMLYAGIVQANVEREAAGRGDVWPRSAAQLSDDRDDIAGMPFKSAVDYFETLFDLRNLDDAGRNSYVSCGVNCLGGPGLQKYEVGERLSAKHLAWAVVEGLADDMPDNVPVLVSRNFPANKLLSRWDGVTEATLPIELDSDAPLGKSAVVVIDKGGRARILSARDVNYRNLYDGEAFDTTEGGSSRGVRYLTPYGRN